MTLVDSKRWPMSSFVTLKTRICITKSSRSLRVSNHIKVPFRFLLSQAVSALPTWDWRQLSSLFQRKALSISCSCSSLSRCGQRSLMPARIIPTWLEVQLTVRSAATILQSPSSPCHHKSTTTSSSRKQCMMGKILVETLGTLRTSLRATWKMAPLIMP